MCVLTWRAVPSIHVEKTPRSWPYSSSLRSSVKECLKVANMALARHQKEDVKHLISKDKDICLE